MGLDFNNSEAHWSYGGFAIFRKKLAEKDGIDVWELKEWGGKEECPDIPMKDFYIHSDCDGELTPQQLEIIVPRFRELLDKLRAEDKEDYDVINGYELLRTMEECIKNDESLIFT